MTHGKSGENKSTEIRVSQNGAGDGGFWEPPMES